MKFVVNRAVSESMPVIEQMPGAMAKLSKGIAQPSQGIANRLSVADAKRISNNLSNKVITDPAEDDKVCWVEMKQYPYQLDHQVELLHLQAEADALLMKLQAHSAKQLNDRSTVQHAAVR